MEREENVLHTTLIERVAETFGQAYFVYDVHGNKFRYYNRAFAALFGLAEEQEETDGRKLVAFLHEEDKAFVFDQYAKLLEGQVQEGVEFRVKLPHQEEKWVCLNCQLVEENRLTLFSGFAEDVTKRKEYQANLLKFNSKKNSTLEILSHDLAAPFSNIEGMIELLETELKNSESTAVGLVQYIKENAKKGSDLIRDFIDNEFLESSQIVLHKECIDICERLQIMVDNYQKMGESLIPKVFELEVGTSPIFMYADVMKFIQVFNNLISNSIKFTPDHGTIKITAQDQGDKVMFSVSDNGIGIPEALKPHLFDRFTTSRREGLKGEKSIGLGMSIIKKIVELHQGEIWYESQEGVGTTFYLLIPKE